MSTRRFDAWAVLAVLQSVAIVLLAWLLYDDAAVAPAPEPRAPITTPTPNERAATTAEATTVAAHVPTSPPTAIATRDPIVADDPMGTLLHGEVRHRSGATLKDATLHLYRGDATKPQATTNLSLDAYFAWPGIQPDAYRLSIRSSGMRTLEHSFVVPPATADLRVDLVLEPSWLLKVLLQTPDGQPLLEAISELGKARPGLRWFRETVTVVAAWSALPDALPIAGDGGPPLSVARWQSARDPYGQATPKLPARYAGVLDLAETRAAVVGAVFGNVVLAQAPVEPGQEEATLVVDGNRLLAQLGTVRLQVVDPTTRQPIPRAKVSIQDGQGFGRNQSPVDSEGRIEVSDLRPGLLTLSITAKGRIGPSVSVEIAPGSATDLGQIALGESFDLFVRVTGRIADKEMRCQLVSIDALPHAALRAQTLHLGARGDEASVTIAPGRYQLRITNAGGALVEFDTRTLGKEPLVVALQPEATLRLDSSALPEPVRLVLRASNGAVVFDRWITWKSAWEQLVLPGSYSIEQRSLAGQSQREELIVPANGARYVLR